jgi:hypothetical protein
MIPTNVPKPIEDFSKCNLNGRKRNRIVVSNHADPRIMDFDFESQVFCNWPSQKHYIYPEGFVEFYNGKKFDRRNKTIWGVPKYLFFSNDVKIYWERYRAEKEIREALDILSDEDLYAAVELLLPGFVAIPIFRNPIFRRRWLLEHEIARQLLGIGLPQLREFTAMLRAGRAPQPAPKPVFNPSDPTALFCPKVAA